MFIDCELETTGSTVPPHSFSITQEQVIQICCRLLCFF